MVGSGAPPSSGPRRPMRAVVQNGGGGGFGGGFGSNSANRSRARAAAAARAAEEDRERGGGGQQTGLFSLGDPSVREKIGNRATKVVQRSIGENSFHKSLQVTLFFFKKNILQETVVSVTSLSTRTAAPPLARFTTRRASSALPASREFRGSSLRGTGSLIVRKISRYCT